MKKKHFQFTGHIKKRLKIKDLPVHVPDILLAILQVITWKLLNLV